MMRDTIIGIGFAAFVALGLWCAYVLYCLLQVPNLQGYHMFG